jgi:hypothetical protein
MKGEKGEREAFQPAPSDMLGPSPRTCCMRVCGVFMVNPEWHDRQSCVVAQVRTMQDPLVRRLHTPLRVGDTFGPCFVRIKQYTPCSTTEATENRPTTAFTSSDCQPLTSFEVY